MKVIFPYYFFEAKKAMICNSIEDIQQRKTSIARETKSKK
jgi:hypothetical protein